MKLSYETMLELHRAGDKVAKTVIDRWVKAQFVSIHYNAGINAYELCSKVSKSVVYQFPLGE
jgi:hypothetical protein